MPPHLCPEDTPKDQLELSEAWALLKSVIMEPYGNSPTWTHQLVREEWCKGDVVGVPKQKKQFDSWKPNVVMMDTPPYVEMVNGLPVHRPGLIKTVVNDVFSFDIRAEIVPPDQTSIL